MSESDAVERVEDPVTVSSLVSDLRELGLEAGDTVIVHSSLNALGWVCGGPPAVVDALQEVLTPSGTLVMPSHSTQYSNPANWQNPPVPDHWIDQIAEHMPPYRPKITPTRGMGAIPECFRNYPEVTRSQHPEYSAAAWGADAEWIVSDHAFDRGLGDESPYARVYEAEGSILLLGVGHETNTSLHLAEHRADISLRSSAHDAPILEDGERTVVEFEEVAVSSEDFPEVGAAFEEAVGSTSGSVGAADAEHIDQAALVDFAADWFEEHRETE